mgnify:CR=1 FL=1
MKLIHKSKYKNIVITLLISAFCILTVFFVMYNIINLNKSLSRIVSLSIGIITFILIGRKIIVRHLIGDNFNVTVEYLLRPNFKHHYSKTDIKNIFFKTIDYGRYGRCEKGIILFKNQKNYHKDYFTLGYEYATN